MQQARKNTMALLRTSFKIILAIPEIRTTIFFVFLTKNKVTFRMLQISIDKM